MNENLQNHYLKEIKGVHDISFSSGSPLSLLAKRSAEKFRNEGVPSRYNEDWRYTNLEAILGEFALTLPNATCEKHEFKNSFADFRLIIENGLYAGCNSKLPKGVTLKSYSKNEHEIPAHLLKRIEAKDAMSALAFAAPTEIIHLEFSEAYSANDILEINYQIEEKSNGLFLRPIILIDIKPFTKVTLIENIEILALKELLIHQTTDVVVNESSEFNHLIYSGSSKKATLRTYVTTECKKDSNYRYFNISNGHDLYRADISATLNGAHASAKLYGLTPVKGEDHVDHFVTIHHAHSDTTSDQLFKAVASDSSRSIFTGKIVINKDAQRVESSQLSKNLLLSKKAQIFTRPQLEVNADDVKCSHGATIGQMSDEELFYLTARGIKEERARTLLGTAFIQDVINYIPNGSLQQKISERLQLGRSL